MSSDLNTPSGPTSGDSGTTWTPARGLVRGIAAGTVTALVIGTILGLIAWHFPHMLLSVLLRAFLGFGIAWVLFSAVHNAAGFVGGGCSVIVVTLSVLVLISHHVIFAVHGVLARDGSLMIGAAWLDPATFVMVNYAALATIGICTWMRHDGSLDGDIITETLMGSVWGTWK